MLKKPLSLVLLLLVVLVPLATLFPPNRVNAANNRLVTLSVDGVRRGFSTGAKSVEEVLSRAGVALGTKDLVEPSADTEINTEVFYINVYRAKPVIVVDQGQEVKVNTPYQNPKLIAERSAGLSVFPEDEYRSEPIRDFVGTGTIGYRLNVMRAVPATITVDGRTFEARSLKPSVEMMLVEKGIVLGAEDIIDVDRTSPLVAGMHITITRVGREVVAVEEVIPPPVETIFDNNKPTGYFEVRQAGSEGKRLVTYEITYRDGIEVDRKLLQSVVISEPTKKVVVRGVTYAGDVWAALRNCESGGDYTKNTGNGFYGAYQFVPSTWRSVAPAEWTGVLPHQAPPEAQDIAAQNLQARSGWGQWPACARQLGLL